ncbi:hypothetical protein HO133_006240 [Letharia lupina]|uniref:Expansin-like EG45 domain-containing protein n=1 Tax=Letharia lupina TaxID=560253 RepID=A0A8H6C6P5_9LECA|nr:uncharacterized protein HO133_006240 [Letharia lupina]KAF6217829.1 hypothetical protein HO133_006240 [Letharia lupina]
MYSISLLLLLASTGYPEGTRAAGGRLSRRQGSTLVPLWGACNYPSQGINGPLPCASGTYAQCREQVGGSWAPDSSWQCQQPGDTATDSSSSTTSSTGDTSSGSGTGNVASPNTNSDTATGSSNSQAATTGDCTSTSAPGGWDGIASTSYYGWMGSSCDCGQNSWEWGGSSGVYNGAVNQKLFQGRINGGGQPNCGEACGGCYELFTSGFNAYNDGVGSGSMITLQIVDSCYSAGDHWCGSTSDDYKDSSLCSVHFDIQTGPPLSHGQAAVGSDGTTWNGERDSNPRYVELSAD